MESVKKLTKAQRHDVYNKMLEFYSAPVFEGSELRLWLYKINPWLTSFPDKRDQLLPELALFTGNKLTKNDLKIKKDIEVIALMFCIEMTR